MHDACTDTSPVLVKGELPQFTDAVAVDVANNREDIRRKRAHGGSRMVAYSIEPRLQQ